MTKTAPTAAEVLNFIHKRALAHTAEVHAHKELTQVFNMQVAYERRVRADELHSLWLELNAMVNP